MSPKVYKSNLSPLWPFDEQDRLLPDGPVFQDEITKRERRSKNPRHLKERSQMLRATSRPNTRIEVAALPVLAYDNDDFLFVLRKAADIGADIYVHDIKTTFPPSKAHKVLHKAAEIFAKAKDAANAFEGGQLGGKASAEKKKAVSKEKTKGITEDMWGDPDVKNAHLCELSGLSINTLRRVFKTWGNREDAIKRTKAVRKRKARKAGTQ